MKTEWEPVGIQDDSIVNTYRMKIPEGWLYRYGSQLLVFVPKQPMPTIATIRNSAALQQKPA